MTPTTELRSLYSITGDIKDINTVLVNRAEVEAARKDAERLAWLAGGCQFAETDSAWDTLESLRAAVDVGMDSEIAKG